MKLWMEELDKLIRFVLVNPDTFAELIFGIAVIVIAFTLIMRVTAGPFGLTLNAWPRIFPIAIIAIGLSLLGVAAVRIYAVPALPGTILPVTLQILIPILVMIVVVMPLQCLLLKGSYLEATMMTGTAVIGTALLTAALLGLWHTVVSGMGIVNLKKDKQAQEQEQVDSAFK